MIKVIVPSSGAWTVGVARSPDLGALVGIGIDPDLSVDLGKGMVFYFTPEGAAALANFILAAAAEASKER